MQKMVIFLVSTAISLVVVGSIVGFLIVYQKGLPDTERTSKIRREFYASNPNPAMSLTDEQAIIEFNEDFVEYLMYDLGANELHHAPFSFDSPKIEIKVEEQIFSVEVLGGEIFVDDEQINEEDIIIHTTREEAVKMLKDEEHVIESFNEGKSWIEPKASKTKLFSKGYLDIYKKLTGEDAEF